MVSVAEACRQLGIQKTKMYALIRTGEIKSVKYPPYTMQAHRKIAQSEIDAFLHRAEAASESEGRSKPDHRVEPAKAVVAARRAS